MWQQGLGTHSLKCNQNVFVRLSIVTKSNCPVFFKTVQWFGVSQFSIFFNLTVILSS